MIVANLDTTRVAVIGPGRLGTSFAYKLGRDNKRVAIYYHNSDVCKAINRDHLNPIHLTEDLACRTGGMEMFNRQGQFLLVVASATDSRRRHLHGPANFIAKVARRGKGACHKKSGQQQDRG